MELFKIENLNFTYPEASEPSLKDINVTINQGEFIVLFGESGSGKTSLLRLLKQALAPLGESSGKIYYKNNELASIASEFSAEEIGFVMQNPHTQIVADSVWHELAFGLENLGLPTFEIRSQVGEVASYFGIQHWFHQKTTDLSGGQKQLLNLAATMAMEPEVLLLDEPTAQLDPIAAKRFIQTLEELNRDFGITIVLVEHELENVLHLADRTLLLNKGEVIYDGNPRNVVESITESLGSHPMLSALPNATKLAQRLGQEGESPLTVREGRELLRSYKSQIDIQVVEDNVKQQNELVLQLKDVWYRYERKLPDVLAAVDLKVYQGEIVSLLGGNGVGKSTLLQVLSGQLRPYKGSVFLYDKKLQTYKNKELYRKHLAVLPQDPQVLFLKNTVKEDYEHFCKIQQLTKAEADEKIDEIINKLEIQSLMARHPHDLSGGEVQKVALGKLLLNNPSILLLDEPTKGIDAFFKEKMKKLLQQLQEEGKTIILVTHDIEFAAQVSHRVGLYFDREIISLETPRNFFRNNKYYTTSMRKMGRNIVDQAVFIEDIGKVYEE